MATRLVPLKPGAVPPIPVQRPVVLIGRHPECDVRIDQPRISRRHCCLALAYDRVMIRDLGSRNGLRVNGLIVEEAQLRPGDEVAIGPILFRVEDPEQPAPRPAAAGSASGQRQGRGPVPSAAPAPVQAPPASPPPAAPPEEKPPSFPFLPLDPHDPDGDLIPLDIDL